MRLDETQSSAASWAACCSYRLVRAALSGKAQARWRTRQLVQLQRKRAPPPLLRARLSAPTLQQQVAQQLVWAWQLQPV